MVKSSNSFFKKYLFIILFAFSIFVLITICVLKKYITGTNFDSKDILDFIVNWSKVYV